MKITSTLGTTVSVNGVEIPHGTKDYSDAELGTLREHPTVKAWVESGHLKPVEPTLEEISATVATKATKGAAPLVDDSALTK